MSNITKKERKENLAAHKREMEFISERELNELQLTKLNAVIKATKIGIWDVMIINNDPIHPDNVFSWSDEFRAMLGYSKDEFPDIADSYYDRLHPNDRNHAFKAISDHLADKSGKTPYDIEYRLLNKNGEYSYFRACGETIRDKDGNAIRVAGAVMDITETKNILFGTEKQRVEAEERAQIVFEAHQDLQLIFNMLPVGVRIISLEDGKLVYANKASMDIFDCKDFERDVAGRSAFDFMPEIQPNGKTTVDMANELFQKENTPIEFQCFKLGGELFTARITSCNINFKGTLSSLAIIEDVTAEKEYQQTLQNAILREQEANYAKSMFLANMSHEMRTPMNAIIGMTAIGKKAKDIEQKNHSLNKIGEASSHLLGVINDVLDMAKIEANKLELSSIEYDFERMIQKLVTIVNFRVDEKLQQLSVNIDSNIPRFIEGDDQRLAQVITNLLSNAVKFTPEGGKIHLGASFIGETDGICELCIEVADSGIGIAKEQQKRLFLAFEQAESGTSRQYGGTGLGLVISKRIVELMDGKIWVESEVGKGARFIFTVKARRGERSPRSLLSADVSWENLRILIVDDEKDTRSQFKDIFNQLDVKYDTASDGFEALRQIEEHGEYDIYFVDWRMPGMDGIELTRRIKSIESRSSVVTMITAADWDKIRNEALEAGVNKYLLKPIFSSMIIDCINECFGSAHDLDEYIENKDGEFTGKRMLLAEDIEINREILIALLEGSELIIDCAENGKEALDMVEAAPDKYDVVFMDVQMPNMDGLEATRRIRALPALQNVKLPIIAMTANVFKDDIEACLAAGMDNHLGKPLDIDKVMETLRKYLFFNG